MNNMKRLMFVVFCLILILSVSSCGLIEQKQEQELAEKLFKEYSTISGDEPYKPINRAYYNDSLGRTIEDTVLIVKNKGGYYQIDKNGNRKSVSFYRIRK